MPAAMWSSARKWANSLPAMPKATTNVRSNSSSSGVAARWDSFGSRPSMRTRRWCCGAASAMARDTIDRARGPPGYAPRVPWEWPIGALLAALIAFVTTPAGVSGAVLLLPVQVSVLGVPSPSVTPTNLLFNVAAIPGGLLRFGREGRLFGPLTWLLVAGTLPGVVAGAVIRVELLPGDRATAIVAAAVLLPLGVWLLAGARPREPRRGPPGGRPAG